MSIAAGCCEKEEERGSVSQETCLLLRDRSLRTRHPRRSVRIFQNGLFCEPVRMTGFFDPYLEVLRHYLLHILRRNQEMKMRTKLLTWGLAGMMAFSPVTVFAEESVFPFTLVTKGDF